jgi:hypothetical protein
MTTQEGNDCIRGIAIYAQEGNDCIRGIAIYAQEGKGIPWLHSLFPE